MAGKEEGACRGKRRGHPGAASENETAPALLEELGVAAEPRETQERAVAGWLGEHEPSQVLRIALRLEGFLPQDGFAAA